MRRPRCLHAPPDADANYLVRVRGHERDPAGSAAQDPYGPGAFIAGGRAGRPICLLGFAGWLSAARNGWRSAIARRAILGIENGSTYSIPGSEEAGGVNYAVIRSPSHQGCNPNAQPMDVKTERASHGAASVFQGTVVSRQRLFRGLGNAVEQTVKMG
ncbi:hypothetical protein ON010_g11732 [Phytophthora cinnamomi]|nr:hypothetical protein ON010_g11732 [Phytophthora cinnamomi]